MPARTLIVDCDPGVDDAVALAVAAASPEVDLRAVTTVAGNMPLPVTTANALAVLAMLGRDDVPVAAGADRALVRRPPREHDAVHGSNGLGGVELPAPAHGPAADGAVALLAGILLAAPPASVTIAAIGPLTNVALLLALHPQAVAAVDRLVVMGGSASAGNVTPVAEFNVWADPEAAARVFGEPGLRTTMVGLDVTREATVDTPVKERWRARSARAATLVDMLAGYGDPAPTVHALHDALALAVVLDPGCVTTSPAVVEVDTGSGVSRGQTVCRFPRFLAADEAAPRVDVAVGVDVERFRALLLDRAG